MSVCAHKHIRVWTYCYQSTCWIRADAACVNDGVHTRTEIHMYSQCKTFSFKYACIDLLPVLGLELKLCACLCVHARVHVWVRAHIYIISYAYMYDTYIMDLIYNTYTKVYIHRPAAISALIGVTADAACVTQCVRTHTHTRTRTQTYTHTCTCILLYVRVFIISNMVYTTHPLPSKHLLGLKLMLRVLQSAYTHADKHTHTPIFNYTYVYS